MQSWALPFTNSTAENKPENSGSNSQNLISIEQIESFSRDWFFDSEYRQHSKETIKRRRELIEQLLWFLREKQQPGVNLRVIRQFLAYFSSGSPEEPRWGNADHHACLRPASRATVHTAYSRLRTFFRWCVNEELIAVSPMKNLAPPENNKDQVAPFTADEIQRLLAAARETNYPRRDEAICIFLLDTGVRVSELANIRLSDIDWDARKITVLGKGQKERAIYFGHQAKRALWSYLSEDSRTPLKGKRLKNVKEKDENSPLFVSEVGERSGEAFSRQGLLRLIVRLGKRAGISGKRVSPHTFRHTFAVEFLRAGGNVFTLKELLGHTSLHMTNRYVSFAQADLENQHRQFSPADRMRRAK